MKVRFLPLQPHCFAFGGFEIQMLSTLDAVKAAGTNAEKLDVWSRSKDFDVLHVWGLDQSQYNTIYWAKREGKKVVVTALLPYMESVYQKLRHVLFSEIGNEKYMRKICSMIDALVLVNDLQKKVAIKYFGSKPASTFEIPNVVSEEFFKHDKKYSDTGPGGLTEYVLVTGNVCRRKNQLSVARACAQSKTPLLVIGPVLAGEQEYGSELRKVVEQSSNIKWIEGLEAGSPEMVRAVAECALMVLPSYTEQQPISLLEAAVCGKPLVIADREYAHQKYYENSCKVDPDSIESIQQGISKVISDRNRFTAPASAVEACRASSVGREYVRIYGSLLA
ncbi:MAG TPA: glycosyltransferase family 4 protein [Cyclobacteriaceae bacterium]|nr:glycosyltransferase family 4 protein [Cyclobacteriaceae bacterium]